MCKIIDHEWISYGQIQILRNFFEGMNEPYFLKLKKWMNRILSFKKPYVAFKSPGESIIYCDNYVVWKCGFCLRIMPILEPLRSALLFTHTATRSWGCLACLFWFTTSFSQISLGSCFLRMKITLRKNLWSKATHYLVFKLKLGLNHQAS